MELKDLKYLLAYIIPITGFVAVGQAGITSYLTLFVAFLFIPLLEVILGEDNDNLDDSTSTIKADSVFFDWLLYLNIPIFYGLLWFFFSSLQNNSHHTFEIIGLILSVGTVGGSAGINVAHELGHKKGKWNQFAAKTLLCPTLYMHFIIEHNKGHHVNVSTPEDPATSRYGETLYTFWIRSVVMSYIHAWKLEKSRLVKSGKSFFSSNNEMIKFSLLQVCYLIVVYIIFGELGLIAAIGTAVVAFLMLETINYVEHYGLVRKLMPSGRYERVDLHHSWNSDHSLGRIMLYELTRHSDHHFKASKKYQVLNSYKSSPQLPFGYPTSMLISLIPPLWFFIMNDRISRVKSEKVKFF